MPTQGIDEQQANEANQLAQANETGGEGNVIAKAEEWLGSYFPMSQKLKKEFLKKNLMRW